MNKTLAALCILLALSSDARADVAVPYTVPRDGRVSLALFSKDGQLVRALLTGIPRKAGSHTESWDGLDRYGLSLIHI